MPLTDAWRSLFGRSVRRSGRRPVPGSRGGRPGPSLDVGHLHDFVTTRVGVEAYLEPPTNVVPPTVLLIASDGEWTRRRVRDRRDAEAFTQAEQIPLYDVNFTGYPPRMREWTARARRSAPRSSDVAG